MIIGIDLGTTNSLVACFRNGNAEIIPNRLGKHLTPSVVSVDEEGTVYVGETAKERGILHPLETARVFKRSMGTDKQYNLGGKTFRAEELSSLVLRSLKEDAEVYLGEGKDVRYLVFDLGGGTFDVSILELYGSIMEVHAIAGDNFIGGEDFTSLLCTMFLEKMAIAPESLDIQTINEVYKAAEAGKCAFSENDEVTISCTIQNQLCEMNITLSEYEKACAPLLEKLRRPIERRLRDAGVSLDDIDQIVLVGGATRLPIIRRFVSKLFKRIPKMHVDPDEVVALGAALQCGMKTRDKEIQEVVLTDVCPYTLGTEVVESNGLFEEDGHYLPIIERNTVIPVSRTQTVFTAHDNQTRVNVKVLQGESRMAYHNLLLGEISVPVPAGPKGKESIDITYTYDVNSLLEVEILVHSTGVKRKIIIQNEQNRLTEEEAAERLEKLQYLKQNPRDEEANRLQILRGERLYEEIPSKRFEINHALMNFEQVLSRQDRTEIEQARKTLTRFLDKIEFNL